MKALILCLALAGCAPHAYHLGVGAGTFEFDERPLSAADTRTVYAGVSWYPQQRAHEKRMETMALAGLTNYGLSESEIEALFAEQDAMDDETVEEHITDYIPPVAETVAASWPFLIWAGAVAILALAMGALWYIGFPLPMVRPRNGKPN